MSNGEESSNDDLSSNVDQNISPDPHPQPSISGPPLKPQSVASGLLINGMTIPELIIEEMKANPKFKKDFIKAVFSAGD